MNKDFGNFFSNDDYFCMREISKDWLTLKTGMEVVHTNSSKNTSG